MGESLNVHQSPEVPSLNFYHYLTCQASPVLSLPGLTDTNDPYRPTCIPNQRKAYDSCLDCKQVALLDLLNSTRRHSHFLKSTCYIRLIDMVRK